MEDLISVIISVYNGENYISRCIESILAQTYKNLEIIIVDDGSTDDTPKICKKYKNKDKRIKIVTQKNLGLGMSRNAGMKVAKGKYVFFMDVDDLVAEDIMEYLHGLCAKYDAQMAISKPLDIYGYDFEVPVLPEKVEIITGMDFLKRVLVSTDKMVVSWNKLIRKDVIKDILFEKRIANDVTVTHKWVEVMDKIVCGNQYKYFYMRREDSITGKEDLAHTADIYKAVVERYEYLEKKYPQMAENRIAVMSFIMEFYMHDKKETREFLVKVDALGKYREVFRFGVVVRAKVGLNEKIKMILFRLNPKLYRKIIKLYLKVKRVKKY